MTRMVKPLLWLLLFNVIGCLQILATDAPKVLELWPSGAPDQKGEPGEERDTTGADGRLVAGKRVIRLGNVSKPTIAVYRPIASKDTGAAVIVCPGGGYKILALDLEGTEVCEWLNSIGVTGVLLKYRVPNQEHDDTHVIPLQDAQRALGLVRFHSQDWHIDPKRIGVLGFSAGGHLAAALSNNFDERKYPRVDAADEVSCRPDFSLLIYPAYLTASKTNDSLAPEMRITSNTPPTFMTIAADDPVRMENVVFYALGLRQAKVPVEFHVYAAGGHGYGLRPEKDFPVTTWPDRVTDWLRTRALLQATK